VSSGPARNYSWPPFEPGHLVNLRHGARAPSVYGPIAVALAETLVEQRPRLAAYPEAVAAWATAEARADLLRRWLEERGTFDEAGELRSGALGWLLRVERQADQARQRLGLDPRSDAQLARETAEAAGSVADLDAVRSAGREALKRAEGVELLEVVEVVGDDA
jgi:hypothetical protein